MADGTVRVDGRGLRHDLVLPLPSLEPEKVFEKPSYSSTLSLSLALPLHNAHGLYGFPLHGHYYISSVLRKVPPPLSELSTLYASRF